MNMYNEYLTAQWYNGTYLVGRPFANNYSSIYKIFDNDEVVVLQRFSQSQNWDWLKWGEWNKTERLTINKHEPILKLDVWVRNQNASSQVSSFNMQILRTATWGTVHSIETDQMRGLTTYTDAAGRYSVGLIGFGQSISGGYGGVPDMNLNNWTLSAWRHDLSTQLHGTCMVVLGSTVENVVALADRIGAVWNDDAPYDAYDLVIAENEVTGNFDAYKFFDGTTTIYPSGTTESIMVNGMYANITQAETPIENYKRLPFMLTFDDHAYENYTALYWRIFNYTREFEIHWTLNLNPNQPYNPTFYPYGGGIHDDAVLRLYENYSRAYQGTQLEIGNHGYNHTTAGPTLAEAFQQAYLCEQRWAAVSPNSTVSMVLSGNSWGYDTTAGVAVAGIKSLRMGYVFGGGDSTLTHDDNGVLVYSWQFGSMEILPAVWHDIVDTAKGYGQAIVQSHQLDFLAAETNHNIPNLFSWIQNSSDLISLTQGQFNDIKHGALRYSVDAGHSVIDLTDCIDDHAVWFDRSMMGEYLFVDETTGEPAPQMKVTSDFAILYAHKGHTYRSVPVQVSPLTDQTAYVWLKNYSVVNDSSDAMEIEVAQTSGTCEFVIEELYPSQEWEVSVDDEYQARLTVNASGTFNWTYSNGWSTHTFAFERVQSISEAFSSMMPMLISLIVVSVLFSAIGIFVGVRGKAH